MLQLRLKNFILRKNNLTRLATFNSLDFKMNDSQWKFLTTENGLLE